MNVGPDGGRSLEHLGNLRKAATIFALFRSCAPLSFAQKAPPLKSDHGHARLTPRRPGLTETFTPEVSRVSFQGTRLTHGSRRHYNYTSPIYQQKVLKAITEALAEHYQAHPAVIGWQIDNELNCHPGRQFCN